METAITEAITETVVTITAIGTAAMAVVVAFMIWRKSKQAGNKV